MPTKLRTMNTSKLSFISLIFLFAFFALEVNAQKNNWGGNVEFGYPSLVGRESFGGTSYHPMEYFAFGFTYIRAVSPKFDFETGLTYSRSRFSIRGGGTPLFPTSLEFVGWENMITSPFYLKWNVSPHFFLNGGPNFSWNMGENTYDPGYGFGIGYQLRFNGNKKLLINPMYQARGMREQDGRGVRHLGLRLIFTTSPSL